MTTTVPVNSKSVLTISPAVLLRSLNRSVLYRAFGRRYTGASGAGIISGQAAASLPEHEQARFYRL